MQNIYSVKINYRDCDCSISHKKNPTNVKSEIQGTRDAISQSSTNACALYCYSFPLLRCTFRLICMAYIVFTDSSWLVLQHRLR